MSTHTQTAVATRLEKTLFAAALVTAFLFVLTYVFEQDLIFWAV